MMNHDQRHDGQSARTLIPIIRLSGPAKEFLQRDLSLHEFFDHLIEADLRDDSIRVLPFLMSRREAVWWGCLCSWEQNRQEPSLQAIETLLAAVRWVQDPSEASRLEAERRGAVLDYEVSASTVAMAAAWSGGNLNDNDAVVVPPPPYMTQKLAGTAVIQAAVERDFENHSTRYRHFLGIGLDVLNGRLTWTRPMGAAMETSNDVLTVGAPA